MMQAQLGMIPSWQFSSSPTVNIKLNDNVSFPPGWSQSTVQPVGAYYTAARIAQPNLGGLGSPMSRLKQFMQTPLFGLGATKHKRGFMEPSCCEDCRCGPYCNGCPDSVMGRRSAGNTAMRGLGEDTSWAYEHRRALLLSGLGLLTAAALGVTAHFIK